MSMAPNIDSAPIYDSTRSTRGWEILRFSVRMRLELARQPLSLQKEGGKSGLHRVKRQVTPGGREPTESATENKPPKSQDR